MYTSLMNLKRYRVVYKDVCGNFCTWFTTWIDSGSLVNHLSHEATNFSYIIKAREFTAHEYDTL